MSYIDIVFDGPPDHEAPRFVEVENEKGESISAGEWLKRPDGCWVLRITIDQAPKKAPDHEGAGVIQFPRKR